jgi:phosphate:Na+ symporter
MFTMLSNILGGVGLFLLGMTLMTEGLKSFAGDSLRKALLAFTRRPVTAFFSGIAVTALIQSSSATTLMTIGFVSAGILPFSQSVGVLMGSALGTTSTGWIISVLGLSVSISSYALFFIAAGSATRLFVRGRGHYLGTALAGFGLIFLGIGLLQTGMSELTSEVDLSILPSGTIGARLLVVVIGVVLTVMMQSCSAVMATNLMALSAGAMNFEQSAAIAIGAAIGTTVKAGLVAIGASIHVKRTALALITFSLTTGFLAFLLMPVLLGMIHFAQRRWGLEEGAVSLAVFHSMFIAMGVALFLPFVHRYSAWIERLLPDRGTGFTRFLDKSLLSIPCVALEAIGRSLRDCRSALAGIAVARIHGKPDETSISQVTNSVNHAISEVMSYLSDIEMDCEDKHSEVRRISDFHIMDHLQRLAAVVELKEVYPGSPRLLELERRLATILEPLGESTSPAMPEIQALSKEIAAAYRAQRRTILEEAALVGSDPAGLLKELDTLQWLNRVAYHFSRIETHLATATDDAPVRTKISRSQNLIAEEEVES